MDIFDQVCSIYEFRQSCQYQKAQFFCSFRPLKITKIIENFPNSGKSHFFTLRDHWDPWEAWYTMGTTHTRYFQGGIVSHFRWFLGQKNMKKAPILGQHPTSRGWLGHDKIRKKSKSPKMGFSTSKLS